MQIHWHHMRDLSEEQRGEMEYRLRRLAAEHQDLIDVRIGAEPNREHRHGPRRVRIAGQARRKELVVVREASSIGEAASDGLCAFERGLRKLRARRLRRALRPAAPPARIDSVAPLAMDRTAE